MSPRLLFAYLVLSLLEPILAMAKPPDLPMDLQVDCRDRKAPLHKHHAPRHIQLPPNYPVPVGTEDTLQEAQEMPEGDCPCLDAGCMEFLEILGKIVEAVAGDQAELAEQAEANDSEVLDVMPKEVQTTEDTPEQLSLSPRHTHAKHLYRIAERCRHRGDLDMARNCYEEVCRIAPKSSYGLLASGHLMKTKGRQAIQLTGDSETQEPPTASENEEEQALIEELLRMADQLRKQSHAEPVCPFRRMQTPDCPNPRPVTPAKPISDDDQPMSDAEMQEMLDDAQFLDTFLDDLVYPDGDIPIIEDGQPPELTVAPAPRDLTIVEEPQRPVDKSVATKAPSYFAKPPIWVGKP